MTGSLATAMHNVWTAHDVADNAQTAASVRTQAILQQRRGAVFVERTTASIAQFNWSNGQCGQHIKISGFTVTI